MGTRISATECRKNGCGHDDVADGAESDNEDAFHGAVDIPGVPFAEFIDAEGLGFCQSNLTVSVRFRPTLDLRLRRL